MNKWLKIFLLALVKSLYIVSKYALRVLLTVNKVISRFTGFIGTIIIIICLIGGSGFADEDKGAEIGGIIIGALLIVVPQIIEDLSLKIFSGFGWLINIIENA